MSGQFGGFMDLNKVVIFVTLGFLAWVFWRQLAVREKAFRHAAAACEQAGVQMLDQSIGLAKLRWAKLQNGQRGILREYRFEFTSTGEQRYTGRVFMVGETLQQCEMDAFRDI